MAQYARYRKERGLTCASRPQISREVKKGTLRPAFRPDGLIDFEAADRLIASRAGVAGPVIETAPLQPNPSVVSGSDFMAAKARREQAEAELAEIKLAKARGELFDVGEGRRAFRAIGKIIAGAREGLPTQLAPQLVGKTEIAEIEAIMRAAMRDADERASEEIEARFAVLAGVDEGNDGEE